MNWKHHNTLHLELHTFYIILLNEKLRTKGKYRPPQNLTLIRLTEALATNQLPWAAAEQSDSRLLIPARPITSLEARTCTIDKERGVIISHYDKTTRRLALNMVKQQTTVKLSSTRKCLRKPCIRVKVYLATLLSKESMAFSTVKPVLNLLVIQNNRI